MNKKTEHWREWVSVRLRYIPKTHFKKMRKIKLDRRGRFLRSPSYRWGLRHYPSVLSEFNNLKDLLT